YRVDDIRCAVYYLTTLEVVDEKRIGALGVCAGGGYTVNAAMTDRRIKAVGTVVGVNLGRIYRETNTIDTLENIARQRNSEAKGGEPLIIQWIPRSPQEAKDAGITDIDILEAVDYYTTPRGQHKNSPNKVNVLSFASIISFDAFRFAEKLLTQPLQIIIGEKPGGFGSYRDGYEIFHKAASTKKDLMIVKDTSHYDLYDKPEPVQKAVAKLSSFFKENL
ncbi:MAG: alpha/beta hydrolase, partial [Synergistaceae bacterium]|nr:alpha/beta hydrolase [Synergistaceae bacterium]